MKTIIDGKLIDIDKMSISELTELKNELKIKEKELFFKINNLLKETKE